MEKPSLAQEIGSHMWMELIETFLEVERRNNLVTQEERAQLWAGFLATAAGSMQGDIGSEDAIVVLDAVRASIAPEVH